MQDWAGIEEDQASWELMRRVLTVLFAAASVTMLISLLAPDPDTSDHTGDAVIGTATTIVTLTLLAWRSVPAWLLRVMPAAGTVAISAAVAISAPLTHTAFFYLWPLLVSAYFLSRLETFLTFLAMCAGYGVTLALWVEPGVRTTLFVEATVTVALVTALVVLLKERLAGAIERLRETATRDALTGVPNRRAFEWLLDREVDRALRGGSVALVVADLDRFKSVNDRLGHAAGDRALKRFCEVAEQRLRRFDLIARIGGEEFAVILPDTDAEGADAFAERLVAAVREETAGDEAPLTVSAGVADCPGAGETAGELLLAADRALYAAKADGRDRHRMAAPAAPAVG
jgi:diguanylate cyclase (GGDEF)-like protein